jgi:hypothetical protein
MRRAWPTRPTPNKDPGLDDEGRYIADQSSPLHRALALVAHELNRAPAEWLGAPSREHLVRALEAGDRALTGAQGGGPPGRGLRAAATGAEGAGA